MKKQKQKCSIQVNPQPKVIKWLSKNAKFKYPPRQWSLVGYPGSGKSSFATQMRGPKLVIDSDHRFTSVRKYK